MNNEQSSKVPDKAVKIKIHKPNDSSSTPIPAAEPPEPSPPPPPEIPNLDSNPTIPAPATKTVRLIPFIAGTRRPDYGPVKLLLKRTLPDSNGNPVFKIPKPLSPETTQAGSQLPITSSSSFATQTQDPINPTKVTTLIHPSAYNTAIGYLTEERIKTILGPVQEPVVFEDDSQSSGSEDELNSDQDVFIVADRSCTVCFRKPPNVSLERHRRLGGFAITHKLGMLNREKKDGLAILTLATTLPGGILTCRHCNDFQVQLRDVTKISRQHINHLMTHGSLLGENPSAEELLQKQPPGPLLCLQCTEVFPSYLALIVHSGFLKDHSEKTEVYCPLCNSFFTNTTLISHCIQQHNNTSRCPICQLGFATIMDLLIHLMNSKPHYMLSPDVQRMLTHKQLEEINLRRQPNTITTTKSEMMVREALKAHNMVHLARYIQQPELFTNFQAEIQDEPFQMPNLVELVAKYLNREDSLVVTELIRNLRFGSTNPVNKTQELKKYFYEVTQINIGLFLKDMWNNATMLPTKLEELMYGPDTYSGPHLLGQSYLTHTQGRITAVDTKAYKAIVIGVNLLSCVGTLPGSPFPILNLSPNYSQEQKWPTHFYSHHENTVQGIVHLEGKALLHLPSEFNIIQHIKEVALKTPLELPIFVEFNVLPFLISHPPEAWPKLLKHSLKNLVVGFFVGLNRVSQEVKQVRGKYPEFIILGQSPMTSNFQLNPTILLQLWYQITISAVLIARFTKTLFIPTTGVIGLGPTWYSNILGKSHPVFNSDQSVSTYTRTQALQVMQYYCRARTQTAEFLSN